jgi:hypothetical protein
VEVISIQELQYFHQLLGEHHQDTIAHGRTTQNEYDKKAYELKNRQYELNDKLKRVIEVDENYSITLITLLNICSRAPELFESSKVEQKRQFINFLLSNLKLRGKTLEFELKKPFDVLVNLQNCKNGSEWLAIANEVRTRIMASDKNIYIPKLSLIG